MQIAGNTILVTGGCSGLGEATARRLVEQEANVIVCDLDTAAGNTLADDLGPQMHFIAADVTSATDIEAAIAAGVDMFGPLRGAINCAGILAASRVVGRDGPHDLELFSRVVQVNLVGTFNVLRLAADAMSKSEPDEQGERGGDRQHVVGISLRRATRASRVFGIEGRSRRNDVADRAGTEPIRHSCRGRCAGSVQHRHDGRRAGRRP